MKLVRVCGQCCAATNNAELPCPIDKCGLVLCQTCAEPEVHFQENGSCPPWWGADLSEAEIELRMQEAAVEASLEC